MEYVIQALQSANPTWPDNHRVFVLAAIIKELGQDKTASERSALVSIGIDVAGKSAGYLNRLRREGFLELAK